MDSKGQVVAIFQFVILLLILAVLLFVMSPIIAIFWNLNVNLPYYSIARPIVDLYGLLTIIGLIMLYLVVKPKQGNGQV